MMRKLRNALRSAYRAEPVLINAAVAFAVAVAARYGFDVDAEWLLALLFGAGTLATRRAVIAPDTAGEAVAAAARTSLRVDPPAVPNTDTPETYTQPELPFGPIGQ